MSTTAAPAPATAIPVVDAARCDGIGEDHAEAYRDCGLLVIRGLLRGEELAHLQAETQALINLAHARSDAPDTSYGRHAETGRRVPCRVDYVLDKGAAMRALLAHPFILRSVERLQGRSFIPTWDALVFKNEGAGLPVNWHVDACTDYTEAGPDGRQAQPIFNVDFYLDRSDRANGVWAIPGSNRWSHARRMAACTELNAHETFQVPEGAVMTPMEPGDVLFHDICVLHGSAATRGPLRRVIYYEYRPCALETRLGPHRPEYIPIKQRVLEACMRERAVQPYTRGERPYVYAPEPAYAPTYTSGEAPASFRVPHQEYWR